MDRESFEEMIRGMTERIPSEYLDGIVEITVSPRVVPHPDRPEIFTLGHCIPIHAGDGAAGDPIQSRVVLYHGSFAALAEFQQDFDWEGEAWETLTHEIRHHVEWLAREESLEAYDEAAEANFARLAGEEFDPLFYLGAEQVSPGVYRVEDDWFVDRQTALVPQTLEFDWAGTTWRVSVPDGTILPAYLLVHGITDPPEGDLVISLRRRARFRDLFRKGKLMVAGVTATQVG
jgi:hypothetical protein